MSKQILVNYEEKPCYEIILENDFQLLTEKLKKLGYDSSRKLCIVTDTNVASHYLTPVLDILKHDFQNLFPFTFEAGEHFKNTTTVSSLYEYLIQNHFDRKDVLIALGGGVVGDLTGFTAATYLRGIDFVQIPTTLLSQVDSSIGGKTGVDFLQYKNMVGAFFQPKLVYMNIETLQTLPRIQFISGMGEIVKHSFIKSADYYQWLLQHADHIKAMDAALLMEMVYQSCLIKKEVVEKDPKEMGERALLNFGHTIGHAVEKLSDFQLAHGQCVGIGMAAAAYLSCQYGKLSKSEQQSLKNMLHLFEIPEKAMPGLSAADVLAATKLDKKMEGNKIKFILLDSIGHAYIERKLTEEQLFDGISQVI